MASRIAQIEKLRGKSLREIRVRGRQEFAKLSERVLGVGAEMSDTALLGEIRSAARNGTGEGSAMLILERIRSSVTSASPRSSFPFFQSLTCRAELSAIIKERFASDRFALLDRAERATRGRFDLLGLKNLTFGEQIDWHLEPTTGKRTPLIHWSRIDYLDSKVAGDKKVTWELNRHAHFVTLGQAYWLTGDERFADAFVSQARSWMDANPPKMGINWASSLELSFRVISWLWALHLFSDSNRLSTKFVSRFFKFLVAQGRHIEAYLSHYFSPNTHLTGEALGLFYLGASIPEFARAKQWRAHGLRVLLEQLPLHIKRDGVYFEQSSYYHRYTVDFYTHLIVLARAANVQLPKEVEERLSLAFDHLMNIARPDGTSPLYGDDDGGRLVTLNARRGNDFRDTLSTGAALFGRSDLKFVAGEAAIETLWLLGPEQLARYDQMEAAAPAETSTAFPESGFFVMRDGWSAQSSYVLADCGPHGSAPGAHAHSDALAFEYAAGGKTWLVDPGTFTYTGDSLLRDQFRSTEAHNTVTVDGLLQSVPAGPFAWQTAAQSTAREFIAEKSFDYFEGSHDGYQRLDDPVTHTRSLLFLKHEDDCELPSFLVVRDQFDAQKKHDYVLRYHLSPGSRAVASGNRVEATDSGDEGLSITAFSKNKLKSEVRDGWVSSCYGNREPAPVAMFESSSEGCQQLVTFLIPPESCMGGKQWPLLVEESPRDVQTGTAAEGFPYRTFSISAADARDVVLIGGGTDEIISDSLIANGSMAWARFAGARFSRGCLISGNSFEVPGLIAVKSREPVRYIALRVDDDQFEPTIEITIHITILGASGFDLSFANPQSAVVVNNRRYDLSPGSRAVTFDPESSDWRIATQDEI